MPPGQSRCGPPLSTRLKPPIDDRHMHLQPLAITSVPVLTLVLDLEMLKPGLDAAKQVNDRNVNVWPGKLRLDVFIYRKILVEHEVDRFAMGRRKDRDPCVIVRNIDGVIDRSNSLSMSFGKLAGILFQSPQSVLPGEEAAVVNRYA